jgi:hypothetical protein
VIAQFTTPCDSSPQKKPADAWPALVALSMRRTLRKLYDGPLFRFRQQGQELDYPENTPDENEDAFVVKIYDQKAYFGYGSFDAEQLSEALQPKLLKDENGYYAYFKLGQYMDLTGNPGANIGKDFTITAIGDGSHPRPMIGIFGVNQVSVEPGRKTNRFTFNDDFGSISKDSGNLVNQLFSGIDPSQNNERVITMKSDGAGQGQKLINNDGATFDTVSVGRLKDRFFEGSFIEVTIHLGGLTKVASDQLWEEAKSVY